jgi:hypothetical protein
MGRRTGLILPTSCQLPNRAESRRSQASEPESPATSKQAEMSGPLLCANRISPSRIHVGGFKRRWSTWIRSSCLRYPWRRQTICRPRETGIRPEARHWWNHGCQFMLIVLTNYAWLVCYHGRCWNKAAKKQALAVRDAAGERLAFIKLDQRSPHRGQRLPPSQIRISSACGITCL